MKTLNRYLSLVLVISVLSFYSCKDDDQVKEQESTELSNKAIVITALKELFINANTDAVDMYWDENYIQHNPLFPNGSALLKDVFVNNRPDGFIYQPGLAISEGDFVVTHNRYLGFTEKPAVVVDVFKVKNGKIVEHWDVLQEEVPAENTASGNPMFPIEYSPSDLTTTSDYKTVVKTALEALFTNADASALDTYWAEDYIQHNPNVPNGRDALKSFAIDNRPPNFAYEFGFALQEGNFVFIQARYSGLGEKPFIGNDIFRLKDGIIVEHWDILQEEVPVEDSVSGNPMFPIK